jgi:DHA1 family multidrug resistance protein-like MFS transporter
MLSLGAPVKRISLLFFIYFLGWGMALPYFSIYLKSLFGSFSAVGIAFGVMHGFALVWALFLGPALDRLNKKTVISAILFLYLPFSPIMLALTTLTQFVMFRMYHAVISTSLWLSGEAYVRGHTPQGKEAQAIGMFDASFGLSQVIGGLLAAAVITTVGFDILYAVSIAALLAFFVSLRLPDHTRSKAWGEIQQAMRPGRVWREVREYLADRELARMTVYLFAFVFAVEFLIMTVPLHLESVGASMPLIGLTASVFTVPLLFESYFSTRQDKSRTMLLGLVFASVVFLALSFADETAMVFFLTVLLGISLAAVHPILSGSFTKRMPKGRVGEYSGVLFATKALAATISPIVAGVMADAFGLRYVFGLGFAIMAALIAWREACMGEAF